MVLVAAFGPAIGWTVHSRPGLAPDANFMGADANLRWFVFAFDKTFIVDCAFGGIMHQQCLKDQTTISSMQL